MPTEGDPTLNGIDSRKHDHADYMALFSVAFQDFRLFSFSESRELKLQRTAHRWKLIADSCVSPE